MTKVVAAAAPAAAVGTVLTKGWQRLSAIDEAEGKLTALGHTTQSTAKIMDSALASVKGTSYGLGEAATISASAVAAGIEPGKELTRYLSLVADTATVAGAPLEDIGLLFNQATTKGKVYTLQLNQLAQRGIPIYQWLAKELGVTQEALSDMVSEGKVDAETYRRAIESNIGGAATAATTVGSQMANTWAAIGRLGAAALEPTFGRLTGWLGSGISSIDDMTDVVKPLAVALDNKVFNEWGPKLAGGIAKASQSWSNSQGPAILADSTARLVAVYHDLKGVYDALWPSATKIAKALMEASVATGVSSWQILLATLEAVAPILNATLVPALQATASLMEDNQGAVTALVLAFAAFKTIPALMTPVGAAVGSARSAVVTARSAVANFAGAVRDSATWARQADPRVSAFGQTMRVVGANASSAFGSMRTAASGVLSALGGPWVAGIAAAAIAVTSIISNTKEAARLTEQYDQALRNVTKSQSEMGDTLARSSGKIDREVFGHITDQVNAVSEAFASAAKNDAKWNNVMTDMVGDVVMFWRGAGDDISFEMDRIALANRQAQESFERLGLSNEQIAARVAGSQSSWEAFRQTLTESGEGGKLAAANLGDLRRVLLEQREAAKNLSPGIMELSEHFATLADTAATAEDKSNALKRTLRIIAGETPDLNDAMQEYNEMVREVAESTAEVWDSSKGWGDALIGENGVDTATENGSKLRDTYRDMIDATAGVVASGGDLDAILASNEEMFKRLETATGLGVTQLMELAEAEGYLPEFFKLTVRLNGATDVDSQLAAIGTYVDQFPDKPLVLKTEGFEGAVGKLREYGFGVEDIGNGQVRINIDDADANAKLDAFLVELGIVNEAEATPGVDLNTVMLDGKAEKADDLIAHLHTLEAVPEADLMIKKLQEGKEVSVQELVDLASQVADPKVILDIAKAMSDADEVDKELDRIVQKLRVARIQAQISSDAPIHSIDAWANTFGGTVIRRATGGPITGGVWGKDSVPMLGMPGEHVLTVDDVNRLGGQEGVFRFRAALQAGQVGRYAEGGPIVESMRQVVQARFPGMELTSGERYTDNGYHSKGMAADFSDGFDSTPTMRALAAWIADNYAGITLQLIHQPFGRNIGQGQGFVGDGLGFYGSGTMSEHRDHVHWAVSEEVGEPTGDSTGAGGVYSKPVEWTEKDELDLEDARVKVLQALEARDKAYANEKKSDADRQAADIKVQRAELKVRELENKRDGKAGVEAITTPAPELEGEMDEDTLTVRRAEIAILDAQLARDKVYSDPESTTLDKEKADIAVYDARNNLDSTIERIEKANEDTDSTTGQARTPRERIKQYFAEMAGIGFDALLEITGLGESRWWDLPVYELDSAKDNKSTSKSKKARNAEIVGSKSGDAHDDGGRPNLALDQMREALGITPQDFAQPMSEPVAPEWIEKHLKRLPLKVYDGGGWLNPNEMAINLGSTPEPIFNSPIQLSRFMSQNANMLEPAAAGAPADYSIKIINPQFANESRMLRAARGMQERQMMRNTGRPR